MAWDLQNKKCCGVQLLIVAWSQSIVSILLLFCSKIDAEKAAQLSNLHHAFFSFT